MNEYQYAHFKQSSELFSGFERGLEEFKEKGAENAKVVEEVKAHLASLDTKLAAVEQMKDNESYKLTVKNLFKAFIGGNKELIEEMI